MPHILQMLVNVKILKLSFYQKGLVALAHSQYIISKNMKSLSNKSNTFSTLFKPHRVHSYFAYFFKFVASGYFATKYEF